MADEQVVVIGRPVALVLAQRDYVAVVEFEIGTAQGHAVVEGEDVVYLNRHAGSGVAAGAVGFHSQMRPFDLPFDALMQKFPVAAPVLACLKPSETGLLTPPAGSKPRKLGFLTPSGVV